jgi:predicted DCC family thiol-disulfide oxidoreductase YuxK
MTLENLPEQLFVSAVGMDPVLDGFSAVLVEIYRERDSSGRVRYVLLKTASATGNRLLRFASLDPSLVASILLEKIGGIRGFEEAAIRLLR